MRQGPHRNRQILLALLVAAVLACSATLAGAAVVHLRRHERVTGINAVTAPAVEAERRTGPFEARIDYAALFSAEGHQVSSQVSWDDEWFFEDVTTYNQELAHTCAVLSAVANAESAYYQRGSTSPAYAEHAFAELGFDTVSTASYRYRSEVLDEVIGVLDGTDVVAYTLATKRIRSERTGAEKELVVVVVRGSYGSEWLSNINVGSDDGSGAPGAADGADHLGFTLAADEIVADLEARAAELGHDIERSYLFCGHSRGGAVANLLASYADGASGGAGAIATADDVRAYTFATPNCTLAGDARDARYDNIFNVLNPADLVPELPLESWGYTRYGQDVWLPREGDASFDDLYEAMRASYLATMGVESSSDPADHLGVDDFVRGLSGCASSLDELLSPPGIVGLLGVLSEADLDALLCNHCPNTYIAWLDALRRGDSAVSVS